MNVALHKSSRNPDMSDNIGPHGAKILDPLACSAV